VITPGTRRRSQSLARTVFSKQSKELHKWREENGAREIVLAESISAVRAPIWSHEAMIGELLRASIDETRSSGLRRPVRLRRWDVTEDLNRAVCGQETTVGESET